MSESPHLGLGYLAPSQAQKHVTVNEAFRRLDAIVQLGVIDRDRTTPPSGPDEGDRHIVAAGATAAWTAKDASIAVWLDGEWVFIEPKPGWLAYVADEAVLVAYLSGGWSGSLTSLEALTKLGVNATADAVNRLAVASQAVLFNHAGAGVQVKLNKAAASDVASFLFQRGFSGRAEFGLVGSDAFSLKVSSNGSSWTNALLVDAASGAVTLPATQRVKVDKFTAGGTWTKPSWATRVVVEAIAGGSGGGSGGLRGSGVAVSGGGGAGAASMTTIELLAADLPATVAVTVGAGGAGGAAQTTADASGLGGALGGTSQFGSYVVARAIGSPTNVGGGGTASAGARGALETYRCLPGSQTIVYGGAGSTTTGGSGDIGMGRLGSGAGGGGGVSAANAFGAGGASGTARIATPVQAVAQGGATEGAAGADGATATAIYLVPGDSGGGGAGGATASGGRGGNGAIPGGAGGGGGAARNGFSSGKGGDGARGEVWVTSYA